MSEIDNIDCKIVTIDLDRYKALEDFNTYKDHVLQPKGYNIFVHNPPLNPENRLIIDTNGNKQKCILEDGSKPLLWDSNTYGLQWEWAVSDVWAWIKDENDDMYHLNISTVDYTKENLDKFYKYFSNLLELDLNIYNNSDKFASYLPDGCHYRDAYKQELAYIAKKIADLDIGYIRRDKEEPGYIFEVCMPEPYLSNYSLEKWHHTILYFAKSTLEEVKFTTGQVA